MPELTLLMRRPVQIAPGISLELMHVQGLVSGTPSVRIGVEAPKHVAIHRVEVVERDRAERALCPPTATLAGLAGHLEPGHAAEVLAREAERQMGGKP